MNPKAMKHKISETAFLVNWARASDPVLSRDPWANLWVTPESIRFSENFRDKISPHEEFQLCLRNRFFTEALEYFEKKWGHFVFLNIASGFTSYPFILNPTNTFIEMDQPHVIEYRQQKLTQFEKNNQIPKRKIHFISTDLNSKEGLEKLERTLKQNSSQPMFVLLEGITYYLKEDVNLKIFNLFEKILHPKSQVGLITWASAVKETPIMQKILDCFEKDLLFPRDQYTWIDDGWFSQWEHLKPLKRADYLELEKNYCPKPWRLTRNEIVDETFYLLEKI